jgi:L-ascorbate metabolism protein UlaG (beta-lactamase superfamily)
MQVEVVYVHHNSFILKLPERTFLFDYPALSHLPQDAPALVTREVAGKRLFVVFSHSHADHLNPEVGAVTALAASVRYIVSDDVPDMCPEVLPEAPDEVLVVAPDDDVTFEGVHLRALESNDLGVAFILEVEGLRLYYGGDLANWDWESLPDKARAESRAFFAAALDTVAAGPVSIAFSNVDKRLKSLAGGPEVVRRLAPALFVPMHTFGETGWLATIENELAVAGSRVFSYRRMGDRLRLDLPPVA